MKTKIIKIGNSRGIRLPKMILDLYELKEGSELEIAQEPEGIFLQAKEHRNKLPWKDAYQEMAAEREESLEWEDWESVSGDGVDD